jgi:hypothetical protein
MTWLRLADITPHNRPNAFELRHDFCMQYGRMGKIIIDAYDEVDPLEAWRSCCEEDYYLGYAEEFIRFVLATPFEYVMRKETLEDLVEATLSPHRHYRRVDACTIVWLITERMNGKGVKSEDFTY